MSNQEGFAYHPVKDLSPQALSEFRQPFHWLYDTGEISHTACLRSTRATPQAHLREVMCHLQFKSICLLLIDQDGSPSLFVHCMNPVAEMLDASGLAQLTIQKQHVLFFMLKPTRLSHAQIQEALNLWRARRTGFTAAVVHSPSDMLVVFSNETVVECVPECFQVSLAFWGNLCPLTDPPGAEATSLWVSGMWASIQELNTVARALVGLKEPGILKIEVDEGWSQLRIRLRRMLDAPIVRDSVTKTLREMGRRCAVKCNRIVLYQCAIPLGPFESIVDLTTAKPAPGLLASLAATDAALARYKQDLIGCDFAYDVVMHLLAQLSCDAILRHNFRYSFSLGGVKCTECVQLILEELFLDRPGRVGYTHIALSPSRNVLAVQVPAEQRRAVEQHVQNSLSALGFAAALIGEGPDLVAVDDPQALALYNVLTIPSRPHPSLATSTVGIRLTPNSISCATCASLLRSTLLRLLSGLAHVAVDCTSSCVVLGLGPEVTEGEAVQVLTDLGYAPTLFPAAAGIQRPIVPPAPVSPPPHYFSCNNIAQPMANGQLNPYNQSVPPSPQAYSASSTTSPVARGYPNDISEGRYMGPVALWQGGKERQHGGTGEEEEEGAPWPIESWEEGSAMLVFNHDPAGPISITIPMRLRHRYTVWYDNVRARVQLQQTGEVDYTLTEVASFDYMPQFWQIWEQLHIEALEEGAILIVFRSDIPPDHNHPANRAGGRWFVRGVATEPRTRLWTKLVLGMLSDTLTQHSDHDVCGVVLSVKPSGDRIEIWVDGGHHPQGDNSLGAHDKDSGQYLPNVLTGLLGEELGHRRFHFWTHAGFERHRKSHRGSVRRAKRHSKAGDPGTPEEPGTPYSYSLRS